MSLINILYDDGLFPTPQEIGMSCSCPDWADMCKHVAATLYGVGARLNSDPDLLFTLRGVDRAELVSTVSADLPLTRMPRRASACSPTTTSRRCSASKWTPPSLRSRGLNAAERRRREAVRTRPPSRRSPPATQSRTPRRRSARPELRSRRARLPRKLERDKPANPLRRRNRRRRRRPPR